MQWHQMWSVAFTFEQFLKKVFMKLISNMCLEITHVNFLPHILVFNELSDHYSIKPHKKQPPLE